MRELDHLIKRQLHSTMVDLHRGGGGSFNWSLRQIRKPPKIPTENASLFPQPLTHSLPPSNQSRSEYGRAGKECTSRQLCPLHLLNCGCTLTPTAYNAHCHLKSGCWLLRFGSRASMWSQCILKSKKTLCWNGHN